MAKGNWSPVDIWLVKDKQKVENAIQWSRNYTLDVFEDEIKQLLQS